MIRFPRVLADVGVRPPRLLLLVVGGIVSWIVVGNYRVGLVVVEKFRPPRLLLLVVGGIVSWIVVGNYRVGLVVVEKF
nr:hypothetical protein [Tanacetum cinerariifolium]